MENNDTVSLLKECDSGTKMAVASIDEVLEKTKASDMRKLLRKSRDHHEQLGNEIHELLLRHHSEEKGTRSYGKRHVLVQNQYKDVHGRQRRIHRRTDDRRL